MACQNSRVALKDHFCPYLSLAKQVETAQLQKMERIYKKEASYLLKGMPCKGLIL